MRHLKLLTAVGVMLAVAASAGATGIPFKQPWQGPVVMHLTNYDDSVLYDWNGGYLADNVTPIQLGVAYAPAQVKQYPGIATRPGESAWGVFRIDQILGAEVTGPNSITPVSPNVELYTDGDAGVELVGIFYGRQDVSVTFLTPGPLGIQQITGTGDRYEVFAQPVGTYNGGGPIGGPGASNRVAGVPNEYPTVGYVGDGTNTLLPGAQRVLTGVSQAGVETHEILANFTPDGGGSGNGTFNLYVSLGPVDPDGAGPLGSYVGTDNYIFDTDAFPNGGATASVPGTTADFRLKGTTEPTLKEWLVRSSDPLTGAMVPEPLTMLGVLAGIGGVAGYIRKRR